MEHAEALRVEDRSGERNERIEAREQIHTTARSKKSSSLGTERDEWNDRFAWDRNAKALSTKPTYFGAQCRDKLDG